MSGRSDSQFSASMKIVIAAVGKTSTPYIIEGISEYFHRLERYIKVETVIIPDVKGAKGMSEEMQKVAEGRQLLGVLTAGDVAVLLDERGSQLSSRQLADTIDRAMNQGVKRLVFMIGGPYGFSDEVYARVRQRISLSRMTFTHEMVRLFFVEQIYRAMTILRGEPYHHG